MSTKSIEQRAIEAIQQFKAVPTTQDAVDQAASELYTADLLRRNAEARYDAAKKSVFDSHSMTVELGARTQPKGCRSILTIQRARTGVLRSAPTLRPSASTWTSFALRSSRQA